MEILASRRALETIPDLLSSALDSDRSVREAAMTALGQLAGPEHVAGMIAGVLRAERGAEREAAEKAVMFVCTRTSDPEQRAAPLLAALIPLTNADRLVVLPTLGRIGGSAARKVIEATIAERDGVSHDVGIRSLCNWPDASIADRLIELTETDPHPQHRRITLRALIRIATLQDERPELQKLELLKKSMAMCTREEERKLVLQRARAIRIPETLRFVLPYLAEPEYAELACETVVELAHHRSLREPHKAEFDQALDKVIRTSKDATIVDRANRYKKGQTWVRPAASAGP
jgi:hypothetical protein